MKMDWKMDVEVIQRDGNFIIMDDEFPIREYLVIETRYYKIYLHKVYPPVFLQKKGVNKGRCYCGVPGLKNCQVVRSPKGNLVANAVGAWGPVVNATEEGVFHVLLSPEETLRRGKPTYVIHHG